MRERSLFGVVPLLTGYSLLVTLCLRVSVVRVSL